MESIAEEAPERSGLCDIQGPTNTPWMLTKPNVHVFLVYGAVSADLENCLGGSGPQGPSNAAWTTGKNSEPGWFLFGITVKVYLGEARKLGTQDLANIPWAAAKLENRDETLFNAIAAESMRKLP